MTSTSTVDWQVVDPVLAISKFPDAGSSGNVIVAGGTASYLVRVANTSAVESTDVVITDPLPTPLALSAEPTMTWVNVPTEDRVATIVGEAGDNELTVTIPKLPAHSYIDLLIPVRAPGGVVAPDELPNTATVTATRIDPISDEGVLEWLPAIDPPVATKTATPSSGAPGTTHTWDLKLTMPANTGDMADVTNAGRYAAT